MAAFALRELETCDESALQIAVSEFSNSDPDWEFAFNYNASADFSTYVRMLHAARRGIGLPNGWVPNTFFVAVNRQKILGRVSLRHELNDYLLDQGGHIGFGVVPSARRMGYGTAMLAKTLPHAANIGLDRVLVTCDDRNIGSIRIIESCGGTLEDKRARASGGMTRRYWIETP